MRYWFMTGLLILSLAAGFAFAAGPDAQELATKGHSLFLQALAGDRSKLAEAVAAMEKSRELDSQNVFNLYNLARAYFFSSGATDKAAIDKAEMVFAKIIELDPKHSRALAFHGSVLTIQSGGRDLAKFFNGVQEMRKAIQMNPDDVSNHIVLPFTAVNFPPEALQAMGGYDPAEDLKIVNRVFEGNSFHYAPHAEVVIKSMLGDVYLQRGEAQIAEGYFKQALSARQPDEAGARAGRAVLDKLIAERMNGGSKVLRTSIMGTCHACHLSAPEKLQ